MQIVQIRCDGAVQIMAEEVVRICAAREVNAAKCYYALGMGAGRGRAQHGPALQAQQHLDLALHGRRRVRLRHIR